MKKKQKALDTKHLTVEWKQLLNMTVQDRVNFFKQGGESYFESLTPTQLAKLFPRYYQEKLPDIGKAVTGITPGTVSKEALSARPAPVGPNRQAAIDKQRERPQPSETARENSFKEFLEKKTQRSTTGFVLGDTDSTTSKIDSKGYVNKEDFYKQAVNTFKNSPLNGFVPKDGERYGIKKGTPEEWANMAMRTAKVESNFRVKTTNLSDPGGSFGLFQFGFHYGVTKDNWQDPQAQLDAFVTYSNKWVKDGGGYILPPRDAQGVKRYNGRGGFGAAFSTFNDDKVNSKTAWTESLEIEKSLAAKQTKIGESAAAKPLDRDGFAPGPATALPAGLNENILKYAETLGGTDREKLSQTLHKLVKEVGVEKVNEYYKEFDANNPTGVPSDPKAVIEKTDKLMMDPTIIDTDLQGTQTRSETYSRVVTNITGYSPGAKRPRAAGPGNVESTSEELSIIKRGIDDRGPSLGYHAAVASFYHNKDTGQKIDETTYNRLPKSAKESYVEKAEVHQLRDPSKRVASMGGTNPATGKSWNTDTYAIARIGQMSPEKIRAYEDHLAAKYAKGEIPERAIRSIHGDGELRPSARGHLERATGGEGVADARSINKDRIFARAAEIQKQTKTPEIQQSLMPKPVAADGPPPGPRTETATQIAPVSDNVKDVTKNTPKTATPIGVVKPDSVPDDTKSKPSATQAPQPAAQPAAPEAPPRQGDEIKKNEYGGEMQRTDSHEPVLLSELKNGEPGKPLGTVGHGETVAVGTAGNSGKVGVEPQTRVNSIPEYKPNQAPEQSREIQEPQQVAAASQINNNQQPYVNMPSAQDNFGYRLEPALTPSNAGIARAFRQATDFTEMASDNTMAIRSGNDTLV